MTDEKKELQETIKTIESARDFLLDITGQIAEKLGIPIEKLSESFEQKEEYVIPKGMVCKMWDKNGYELTRIFGSYADDHPFRYVDETGTKWEHCRPAWDLIFDILGIPEKFKYAACTHFGDWVIFKNKPEKYLYNGSYIWRPQAGEGLKISVVFHPHPDPENSLQERK